MGRTDAQRKQGKGRVSPEESSVAQTEGRGAQPGLLVLWWVWPMMQMTKWPSKPEPWSSGPVTLSYALPRPPSDHPVTYQSQLWGRAPLPLRW